MIEKIAVIGAGGWGTTLANLLAEKSEVSLWVREKELVDVIKKEGENKFFLPGIKLNKNINISNSLEIAKDKEMVVMAVPTQFTRQTTKNIKEHIKKDTIIVSVAKGLEIGTDKRISQILREELGNDNILALSGPNHCEEVSRRMPTATVIASENMRLLKKVQPVFNRTYFKVYPHDDIVGVEFCGSIKNITAISSYLHF